VLIGRKAKADKLREWDLGLGKLVVDDREAKVRFGGAR
jgi:hypothetical protein